MHESILQVENVYMGLCCALPSHLVWPLDLHNAPASSLQSKAMHYKHLNTPVSSLLVINISCLAVLLLLPI